MKKLKEVVNKVKEAKLISVKENKPLLEALKDVIKK